MRTVSLLSLAAVMCAVCLLPRQALSATPRLVNVTGRVVDARTGKPIPRAQIGVYKLDRKTVATDSQGRFNVLAAPGPKRLIYYDGGSPLYRSGPSTYVAVDVPAKGLTGVVLKLRMVDFARGGVVTPSGKPLVGATVIVCGETFARAVTDSHGRFKVAAPDEQMRPFG